MENIRFTTKKERNYLKQMNLPNARTWFRFRCKITLRSKKGKLLQHSEITYNAGTATQDQMSTRTPRGL